MQKQSVLCHWFKEARRAKLFNYVIGSLLVTRSSNVHIFQAPNLTISACHVAFACSIWHALLPSCWVLAVMSERTAGRSWTGTILSFIRHPLIALWHSQASLLSDFHHLRLVQCSHGWLAIHLTRLECADIFCLRIRLVIPQSFRREGTFVSTSLQQYFNMVQLRWYPDGTNRRQRTVSYSVWRVLWRVEV